MSTLIGYQAMNQHFKNRIRLIVALLLSLVGALALLVSLGARALGQDITPGFGAWQMLFLLVGITCFTVAGFLVLQSRRLPNAPRSLQAEIGVRLAATGLVFAYVSGFADLLSIGTHPHANYPRPFVGWLQISGILLGILSILVGMLLYHTSRGRRPASSLEFLIANGQAEARQAAPPAGTETPALEE